MSTFCFVEWVDWCLMSNKPAIPGSSDAHGRDCDDGGVGVSCSQEGLR